MFLSTLITLALAQADAPAEAPAVQAVEQVLGAGTRFETRWFDRRGVEGGPTIMILGGMHVIEPAGPAAAVSISSWSV